MSTKIKYAFLFLSFCFVKNNLNAQIYPLKGNNKKENFLFCLRIMDSLVNSKPQDSTYECLNCVNFLERETGITSIGETTYFGTFTFSKADLTKWHQWYNQNERLLFDNKKK